MPKRQKLSKSEMLDRDIRRWQRAQERALIMQRKAANLLQRSAVELVKLHKKRSKLDAAIPVAEVGKSESIRPSDEVKPTPEVPSIPLDKLGETEIGKANAESWNGMKPKRDRKRKPKADPELPPPDTVAKAMGLAEPQTVGPEAQETIARMKSFGFRPTKKR